MNLSGTENPVVFIDTYIHIYNIIVSMLVSIRNWHLHHFHQLFHIYKNINKLLRLTKKQYSFKYSTRKSHTPVHTKAIDRQTSYKAIKLGTQLKY